MSSALVLDLLHLLLGRGVSLDGDILPLLGCVVGSLDGGSKLDKSLGDSRLEDLRRELSSVLVNIQLCVF